MKILLIDAYDSFVYIVKNYIEVIGFQTDVVRCDKVNLESLNDYHAIILGPGPGHPCESGYLDIIRRVEGKIPIFGICLGMQSIAEFYGVSVKPAVNRVHGKVSLIEHDQMGCFQQLKSPLKVTRYHSLIASRDDIKSDSELVITSESIDDNYIMGIRHKAFVIEGVQFHPESISTERGADILINFFKHAGLYN
ncbi:aminodeoxychorismate/anthranilate synthase component II [Photobacterium sp. CCB-ST2H9]|uniref:anthranilate synthase component II n=1 Tax=Photobacterium sp. CCB-ST2H9 TaxID=2912855 RepID=UPI0020039BDD|nr:aminodeoxychorismate/anthranilate synthase component II [Photobacterium sp. CCB-ST2H9]UTM58647.1 aminodeoxychorismate/anthranilate synthase component II [Photobacterium sp. CCB-ST2H9]